MLVKTAQLLLIPNQLCLGCNYQEYCGSCQTAAACTNDGLRCDDMSPYEADASLAFAAIGGPGFSISPKPQEFLHLPPLLPIAPPGSGKWIEPLRLDAMAVRLSEMRRAAKREDSSETFRLSIGATQSTCLLLNCISDDQTLERLWPHWESIADALPRLGFNGVIAPAYSCWGDHNPILHVYNAKRSLVAFDLLQQSGLPTIPTISAFRAAQWEAWACWLKEHAEICYIAIDFGTLSHGKCNSDLKRAVHFVNKLLSHVRRDMTVLVSGTLAPARSRVTSEIEARLERVMDFRAAGAAICEA